MFINAEEWDDGAPVSCDLCIVGAGAAGITLARHLASADLKVCLLESGGFEFSQSTQSLCEGKVTGRGYFDLDMARLRFFGGSTNHWSGWCCPLDPIDFEPRADLPGSGWPIGYEELEPYYRRAHEICELGPYTYDANAFGDRVPPFYREPLDEYQVTVHIWQRSPPTRFGETYRAGIDEATHVRCFLNANVVGIETANGGADVSALQVRTLGGKRFKVDARIFVLACGGIENARLLLQPTRECPHGVGNDHDQVGRYFMLHPILEVGKLALTEAGGQSLFVQDRTYGERVRAGLGLSPTMQRELGLSNHAILLERDFATSKPSRGYRALTRRLKDPFDNRHSLTSDILSVLHPQIETELSCDVLNPVHVPL